MQQPTHDPIAAVIARTEAALDALDASLVDLSRAAAAKFGEPEMCVWCGGPCVCETYSDWDYDLALALAEAQAAVICDAPADAPRCACCWDILTPDDDTYCTTCALDGAHLIDTPPQPAPDARPVTPPTPPPAAAVQSADDPLPAIARLWGRLECGEITHDRYLELLREGGWL